MFAYSWCVINFKYNTQTIEEIYTFIYITTTNDGMTTMKWKLYMCHVAMQAKLIISIEDWPATYIYINL